jgi:chemotaxis protein MotB
VARRLLARGEEGGGGGHAGSGAGRWLLTYADLITLLMVFFVVMYSVSRVDVARYEALAGSLRESFLDIAPGREAGTGLLSGGSAIVGAGRGGLNELERMGHDIAAAAKAGSYGDKIGVYYGERGLTISLGAVLFDLGQATIRPDGAEILKQVAVYLAKVPNCISVEGYTDDLPIATTIFPSNWELSACRATNVVHFLARTQGLRPDRFLIIGYGEYRPVVPNDTEVNRAKNRRVDIVVLSKPPATGLGEEVTGPPSAVPVPPPVSDRQ